MTPPPRRRLAPLTPVQKRDPRPPAPDPDREEIHEMGRLLEDPRFTDAERAAMKRRADAALKRILARKPMI